MYFLPEALVEYDDDMLARGGLATERLRQMNGDDPEALAAELLQGIQFHRIEIEFRPVDKPFANGALVRDCGNVVDPLFLEWLVSVTENYIDGCFDAAN